ncbi:RNase adaptor protein RapZ [Pseudoruegeria sp. SK021]|nr:RNase adaptor protein RapZ [Pseudoruegeria sp. SK021]
MAATNAAQFRIVLVTGPSGAGRSTAVKVLEDLDCEAIDNLPLSLVPRLLEGPALTRTLVLGIDVRNRDFSTNGFLQMVQTLRAREAALEILYLDCSPDVLLRRFSETRRRHPMAPEDSPQLGIDRELALLAPIRRNADLLIDTSDLTPHDLRAELARWFDPGGPQRLAVTVHSFSYKRGLPPGIDMAFDCRFLKNPHWEPALRPLDGRDPQVVAHIATDARFSGFFDKTLDLAEFLLPAYIEEGKAHLSIGFGCTGGQHRSVAMAEGIAASLRAQGWAVSLRHHELERRGQIGAASEAARTAKTGVPG